MKKRIIDIANKAGVSAGTVDRVLHNRGEVSEATHKKVLDVIKQMRYSPNIFAKSLASNKTYRIAALIPDFKYNNPYWAKPLEGIQKADKELKDFNITVDVYQFNLNDPGNVKDQFNKVLNNNPDGVVFHPHIKETSIQFTNELKSKNIPCVLIDTNLEHGNQLAYFGQDAWQSGYVAGRVLSLTAQPESKILVLHLTDSDKVPHHLLKRADGFERFFTKQNNKEVTRVTSVIALNDIDRIKLDIESIYQHNTGISSVFVTNSRVYMVAGLIKEIMGHKTNILGYDLIEENTRLMEDDRIDFLISQKPIDQGYLGVMSLFNHLVLNKEVAPVNLSSIDIIIKENLEYYK